MKVNFQKAERVDVLKRSMDQASAKVGSWSASKHASANATVDTKQLASFYESVMASTKK